MLHITAMLEGQYLTATRGPESWYVVTVDCITGQELERYYTDQEFGAVLALTIAGDFNNVNIPGSEGLTELLYDFCREKQDDLKNELRLIP